MELPSKPTDLSKRAYEIFEESLKLEPANRDAYVKDQVGGNAALHAEVIAFELADQTNALPTSRLQSIAAPLIQADEIGSLLGQTIGPFLLVEFLGSGGMGIVYKATRIDNVEQTLAIKVVRQGLSDALSRTRFELERTALAKLEHPGVARLIDAGFTSTGLPWYAMEYVQGMPIDHYCKANHLKPDAIVGLMIEVCDAVDAAHRNMIVHRDIKPNNVLVNSQGAPKLIDFGISKNLHENVTDEGMTRNVGATFTPNFAAPEQIAGGPISAATDVYGLGALTHVLLTGKRIFETEKNTDLDYIISALQRDLPKPSLATGTPTLRGDLDNVLLKALARLPSDRYQSAADFGRDLGRILRHEPVIARSPELFYVTQKFIRRNRVAVALGLAVSVVSGLSLVNYIAQTKQVAAERDLATFAAARATRINQFMTSILQAADPRLSDRNASVATVLDQAEKKVEVEMADDPEIAASVLLAISSANGSQTRYPQAIASCERAIVLLQKSGKNKLELANAKGLLGHWIASSGKLKEAELPLRESMNDLTQLAPQSLDLAVAQGRLAVMLGNAGREKEAKPLFVAALQIMRPAKLNDLSFITVLSDYSVLLGLTGNPEEATVLAGEALVISEKSLGPDHASTDDIRANLAGGLSNLASKTKDLALHKQAADLFEKVIDRRSRVLGPKHLDTLWGQVNLANTLIELKQPARAGELASAAREALFVDPGPTHPVAMYSQSVEGRAYCDIGNFQEGIRALQSVALNRLKVYGPDHWLSANSAVLVGACVLKSGQAAEAVAKLLPAVQQLEKMRGKEFPKTQEAIAHLVEAFKVTGKYALAELWSEKLINK